MRDVGEFLKGSLACGGASGAQVQVTYCSFRELVDISIASLHMRPAAIDAKEHNSMVSEDGHINSPEDPTGCLLASVRMG